MKMPNIAVLPALATLGNAICGFAAILVLFPSPDGAATFGARPNQFEVAAYLIFLAMVFDAIDGRLARFARATSDFGGQLDSLSDAISFGVAPAVLGYRLFMELVPVQQDVFQSLALHRLAVVLAAVYCCCAILRLARFNVENVHDEEAHMAFRGLPTPAAAGVVASLIILIADLSSENCPAGVISFLAWAVPAAMLVLGLLMVSRIRYAHLLNQLIRGRRPLSHIIEILCCAALIWFLREKALAALFVAFALSGPVIYLYRKVASLLRHGRVPVSSHTDHSLKA